MKTCTKCHKSKELNAFYVRKSGPETGRPYPDCIECNRQRGKERYRLAPNKHYQRMYATKRQNRAWIRQYKADRGCLQCGFNHPGALIFHHRDPSLKHFGITQGMGYRKANILREIAKCDVLCANCHAIKHDNF